MVNSAASSNRLPTSPIPALKCPSIRPLPGRHALHKLTAHRIRCADNDAGLVADLINLDGLSTLIVMDTFGATASTPRSSPLSAHSRPSRNPQRTAVLSRFWQIYAACARSAEIAEMSKGSTRQRSKETSRSDKSLRAQRAPMIMLRVFPTLANFDN